MSQNSIPYGATFYNQNAAPTITLYGANFPLQLDDIKPGDFGGMEPETFWQRTICRLEGCKTFHWLAFVRPVLTNGIVTDYIISESINKGVSLTRLAGRHVLVYRLIDSPIIDSNQIIDIHSGYGTVKYDWEGNILTAIWYLLKHYFNKVIPVVKNNRLNCVEWVVTLARELGYMLIPDAGYVTEYALEHSSLLNPIGVIYPQGISLSQLRHNDTKSYRSYGVLR